MLTTQPIKLSAYLLECGLDAPAITWPAVPMNQERLRVCFHAGNTDADVEALVKAMIIWAYSELEVSQAAGVLMPKARL